MKTLKLVLTFLFGALMILAGLNHFLKAKMYFPFIPDFLPKEIINYLAGLMEIVLGIGVFIPPLRDKATLGILILMCMFLPLHVWDIMKEHPAIGSHAMALVRLPVQFLFIGWAWFISRK